MWNTSKWRKVLLGLVVVAAIALISGSYVYYIFSYPGQGWMCFCMALQNCMEALLCNPILAIQDVAADKEFMAHIATNIGQMLIMNAFSVAMILVPFIDILIVFSVVDSFLHFYVGVERKDRRVLIVGYNENVIKLIKRRNNKCKVYVWTERLLSTEEERELYFSRVAVKMSGFSFGDNPENYEKQKKKFDKFIRRKKITDIFLLDESDTKNLQYYMALSSCKVCTEKTHHFYVLAEAPESKKLLQEYFDLELAKKKKTSPENVDLHTDLRILNFDQKQAELLFAKLPVYSGGYREADKTVHMLIIGGDTLSAQIALHAINQSVLSADNRIVIDIVDENVESIRQNLTYRFNSNMVSQPLNVKDELHFTNSDGQLQIRFRECDLLRGDLLQVLKDLQTGDIGAFTYVVLCSKSVNKNLVAFRCVDSGGFFKENPKVPVAIRMAYSEDMKQYLKGSDGDDYNIYLMGENEEYISLDHLVNVDEEDRIREYNAVYNAVQGAKVYGAVNDPDKRTKAEWDRQWNELEYYKRDVNRALYFHKDTKEALFKGYEKEMEGFWAEDPEPEVEDQALFLSERLIRKKPETGKESYPTLVEMAKTEHRRWTYFLITEGWEYAENKDERGQKHYCLCDWNTLVQKQPQTLIYDLLSSPLLIATEKGMGK